MSPRHVSVALYESRDAVEIGRCASTKFLHTRFVLKPVAVALVVLGTAVDATAEGERSPMIGGGVIAARNGVSVEDQGLVGVSVEATYWIHRIGLAVEGSRRWDVANGDPLATTFAGGLRFLLVDRLLESLIEPRDVELGLELHGLVERTWWDGSQQTTAYGGGIALRLRGGGDGPDSRLLAESRLFVRVMHSRDDVMFAARSTTPPQMEQVPRSIVVGLSAVWGTGERRYADRFKPRFGTPVTPYLVDPP